MALSYADRAASYFFLSISSSYSSITRQVLVCLRKRVTVLDASCSELRFFPFLTNIISKNRILFIPSSCAHPYFQQVSAMFSHYLNFMQQTKTLKTGTLKPAEIDRDSWEVCDPDRQEDPLPMPYRLIDEVLNDSIMSQVYLGVHKIEKKKKDPNYEGAVR